MLCQTCNGPIICKKKIRKFCSKKCFGISKIKPKPDKICQACGKIYQPWIYRAKDSKFCSQACKKSINGISHPSYGSKNKRWSFVHARRVLPQICKICGIKNGLQVHHIDTNWDNTNIDNFCMLCVSCHHKVHFLLKHGFDFHEAIDDFHDHYEMTRSWINKIRRALAKDHS